MTEVDQQEDVVIHSGEVTTHTTRHKLVFQWGTAILRMHKMIIWALQLLPRIKGLCQQISMSVLQRTRIIWKVGNWDVKLWSDWQSSRRLVSALGTEPRTL